MEKDFCEWGNLKKKINSIKRSPTFNEREIWWCSIGLNVGHEEDGKSSLFSRPVLVVRKFNRHIFLGLPLTTSIKDHHKFYFRINFKEKEQSVIMSQMRVLESKRLTKMKGKLSMSQFNNIGNILSETIMGIYPTP